MNCFRLTQFSSVLIETPRLSATCLLVRSGRIEGREGSGRSIGSGDRLFSNGA